MRIKKLWVLFLLIIILISFSGCTEQHYFSYQEKEIAPNESFRVHEKADTTLEIGYSWIIINITDNIGLNKTIFRIIAPSGKEILTLNTTEKNRLFEGNIKCKEDGIYELYWENTDSNHTITIKYDWDWVQENAMLYDFICYGMFLLILLVILILGIRLYMKHKKIKILENQQKEIPPKIINERLKSRLRICKECGNSFSGTGELCNICNAKMSEKKVKKRMLVVFTIVIFSIIGYLYSGDLLDLFYGLIITALVFLLTFRTPM